MSEEKEKDYSDMNIQLELKDRINYPFIIQTSLLVIKRMMMKDNVEIEKIEDMMWDLFTDIPRDWYDSEFIKEVKISFIPKEIDVRPLWGDTKLSIETCNKFGYSITKKITTINYFILKNAIINLLHRRDMLVRKKKIEYSTGKNLDIKTIDDLAVYEEEIPEKIDAIVEKEIKAIIKEDELKDKKEVINDINLPNINKVSEDK